ncbi:hypothetical protein HGRIS_006044 [Hohenbuehelia grisea]|uniref:NudC domain-containing protein 1 n=1 Tax=Hohenbuehelia grisea TaxID=104357 RepID=A0ABR3JZV2_9AGAR
MSTTFTPNRALINSKFEGYKLDAIAQENVIARHSLPSQATQATVSGRSFLSFQEVQSRITHNHLVLDHINSRALYVDSEFKVILIGLVNLRPVFRTLYELPKPVSSQTSHVYQYEYPSAKFVGPSAVLVSDGHGTLYVLEINAEGPATCVGAYQIPDINGVGQIPPPFRVHDAIAASPDSVVAVLSSRHPNEKAHEEAATKGKHSHVEFDITAVRLSPSPASAGSLQTADLLWHRRGDDVPFYVTFDAASGAHLLVGSCVYRPVDVALPTAYEPSPDEIAPIPQAGENLDEAPAGIPKPPPYSWVQTSDSVTVAFPLPSTTSKTDITVSFSPRSLTLHVNSGTETPLPMPDYHQAQLWDTISPSSSYWTWDKQAEHTYGLLTLHLDKQPEDRKWSHVLAASESGGAPDVPETLDPSELWHIREALEKYTAALQSGGDASGLGLGTGVPSLAEGEMDEEVDAAVGRTALLTWVAQDGSVPAWFCDARQAPFTVLSTPLPGSEMAGPSLILKSHIDGTLFSLRDLTAHGPTWEHTSSFSALSFVLASKRDTRFTYHVPGKAVFAFENGVKDRGGNVYIYRAAASSEKWAKQVVLHVIDGSSGTLLGVGALQVDGGRAVLLCLTDGELITVTDVI